MPSVSVVILVLLVLIGLVGIVVPVLPGLLLVLGAIWIWVLQEQSTAAWWVGGIVTVLYVAGMVLEYLLPGRSMKRAGVRTSTLVIGVLVAIVGAFVIPVVGALLGFPLGIYLVERSRRSGHGDAWVATKHAVRAIATNILVELLTALSMIAVWVGALLLLR